MCVSFDFTVGDAAKQLEDPELMQEFGASYDMLVADVSHHYNLFAVLEQSLHFPKQLIEQWTLQLHPDTQSCVIERYNQRMFVQHTE